MQWNRFTDLAQAERLVRCIGGVILRDLFSHLATDYRHRRSGFPDLVVWNANKLTFKVFCLQKCSVLSVWKEVSIIYVATLFLSYLTSHLPITYQVVEVKGPGDKLSAKQQLWLNKFATFGAAAEVCYVNGQLSFDRYRTMRGLNIYYTSVCFQQNRRSTFKTKLWLKDSRIDLYMDCIFFNDWPFFSVVVFLMPIRFFLLFKIGRCC